MAENFNISNGFNLGLPTQHHNPSQPQQQAHIPPGVTSPQNGALWNELQQRYVNQVQHTQQLNQNAQQQQQPLRSQIQGDQNQNQNSKPLLQLAAQRLTGITPQQFADMPPQQREQLRKILENQLQHQQQQQQQPTPAPPSDPSTQPNIQSSPQVSQQPQPGQPGRPMQLHEFFTFAFNNWLAQRQLMLDPPRIDGKEVELHKLFLMVGALGGCRSVWEKKLWPVVGAKIGYPYFNGPLPYCKPEVADQLSKIYQKILADFEIHWHNSLRPGDPSSIFPLPPQLQYLHPELERLATAQFPLRQQQPQQEQPPERSLGAGPSPQRDDNARGPTSNQMDQQTPQVEQTQATAQQQEVLMRNQPGVLSPPQTGPSGQRGLMGVPSLANLPAPLQQVPPHVNNQTKMLSHLRASLLQASGRNIEADHPALKSCFQGLGHLFVEPWRLMEQPGYETRGGGYGDVRVCILDPGTMRSKRVAVKTVRVKEHHKEQLRLVFRLARELKVWARLHHPHVLPVLGYYLHKHDGNAVLIAEYQTHGDLNDYLSKADPSWDIRRQMIRDSTDGLAYLHSQNPPIRHGDLKPANILISAKRRAMLADFGLSKIMEDGPTGLSTSGGPGGTFRYISPELLEEDPPFDLSSDIWAWACLAFEVLAKKVPYATKKNDVALTLALASGELPGDTEDLRPDHPDLKSLLNKCWSVQPDKRPSAFYCLNILNSARSPGRVTAVARL